MKIEEGKYYRTRDGQKVGPMVIWRDEPLEGAANWSTSKGYDDASVWHDDGKNPYNRDEDLIAEWVDEPAHTGPVRTRSVTEIVPGGYSGVRVDTYDDTRVRIGMQHTIMDAAYLRAASAVFVRLADALEGGAE